MSLNGTREIEYGKIEGGIPIPPPLTRTYKDKWPFGQMKIGDSFVINNPNRGTPPRLAAIAAKKYGFRFCTRRISATETRIWRIE